jgi:hypothetical protein
MGKNVFLSRSFSVILIIGSLIFAAWQISLVHADLLFCSGAADAGQACLYSGAAHAADPCIKGGACDFSSVCEPVYAPDGTLVAGQTTHGTTPTGVCCGGSFVQNQTSCKSSTCGAQGQSCCAGSTCNDSSLSCQGGTCKPSVSTTTQQMYACNGSSCVMEAGGPFSSSNCSNSCSVHNSCWSDNGTCYGCDGTSCTSASGGIYGDSSCDNSCSGSDYGYSLSPPSQTCAIGDTVQFTAELNKGGEDNQGNPVYTDVTSQTTWASGDLNSEPTGQPGAFLCLANGTSTAEGEYEGPDGIPSDGSNNIFTGNGTITIGTGTSGSSTCTGAPALVVAPGFVATVPGKTLYFTATYYPNGASCATFSDATQSSSWGTTNGPVAYPLGNTGAFTTNLIGTTNISATYGAASGTALIIVQSPTPPDFSLSVNPSTESILADVPKTAAVHLGSENGYSTSVNLYLEPASTDVGNAYPLPSGISASFGPAAVTPTGNSTLTILASASTAPGTYNLYVVGSPETYGQLGQSILTGTVTGHSQMVQITVSQPVLPPFNSVTFSASPTTATSTVTPVTFSVWAGGTATGTINYTFWWNCPSAVSTVAGATAACGDPSNASIGYKDEGEVSTFDQTTYTYPGTGTMVPKIIIERGSAPSVSTTTIVTVVANTQGPVTHGECESNSCNQVSGSGANRCLTDADCGGPGGNLPTHGVCSGSSCVNTQGSGSSTCSVDSSCPSGDGLPTYITCEYNSCLIVDGTGPSDGCSVIGATCTSGGGLSITPSSTTTTVGTPTGFTVGGGTCANWSATGSDTFLLQNATNASVSWSSAGAYQVTCTDAFDHHVTANVTVSNSVTPTCTFSANPAIVIPPIPSKLTWSCSNATSCSITGGIYNDQTVSPASGGTFSVSPSATTQYTLDCLGLGGGSTQKTAIVDVSGAGVIEVTP